MPRSLTAAVSAAAQETVTNFATCWKVTLTDGAVLGFTNHVQDVVVSSVTYEAETGYAPSSIDSSNRYNVDNLELAGVVTGSGVTVGDLAAGRYDGAVVDVFIIDWTQPNAGQINGRTGIIGQITRRDNDFTAEVRGLLQRVQQNVTKVYAPGCRATLGDSDCKVQVSAPFWATSATVSTYASGDAGAGAATRGYVRSTVVTSRIFKAISGGTTQATEPAFTSVVGSTTADGSTVVWETMYALRRSAVVSTVTDRANFTCSDMDEPSEHFKLGKATFKSGNNISRSMEVKQNSVSGVFELYLKMPSDIQTGDIVVFEVGCGKRLDIDCRVRFNNLINFRAEPFVPGRDALIGGGKASS